MAGKTEHLLCLITVRMYAKSNELYTVIIRKEQVTRTGHLFAKQVLSQLSYTPTVGVNFYSKAFRRNPKSVPSLFGYQYTYAPRFEGE